jgi:hypothetical protein
MAEYHPAPFAIDLFKAKVERIVLKHAFHFRRHDPVLANVFRVRTVPIKLRFICPQAYK